MAKLIFLNACDGNQHAGVNGREARETLPNTSPPTALSGPLEQMFSSPYYEADATPIAPHEVSSEDVDLARACNSFAASFRASEDALFTDAETGVCHESLGFSDMPMVQQQLPCISLPCGASDQPISLLRNPSGECAENSDDNFKGFVASKATEERQLFAAWVAAPAVVERLPVVESPSTAVEAAPASSSAGLEHRGERDEGGVAPEEMEESDSRASEPSARKENTQRTGGGKARKAKTSRNDFCRECGATSTPQWREGPEGPRTLCNRCGVRYKKSLKSEQQRSRQAHAAAEFTKRQRVH
ncbi:hypothetical protein Agub_g3284 [Astrephomene gubernaculifera]|uniref:GATA-type domain-containing protein n=1 Tax=Astrephomene gubernaculifera TaxID=47775 RepID=A0AAD3DJS9_9CHLO|nr:hypothetical protein Agub_g3284 [Astrephomene gubernaculifera]